MPTVRDADRLDSAAKVVLRRGRARPLWFGHPWVYGDAVDRVEGEAQPGAVVTLVDHDGRFVGRGMYNPRSQIPVRLLSRTDEPIDRAFFSARLAAARLLRGRVGLPSADTTAYRLVNSEGDGLPGLVIDVFGDAAVVQVTTLGMALRRAEIFDVVAAEIAPATVYEVAVAGSADLEGFSSQSRVVHGASLQQVPCLEDGIKLAAEPLSGQKTGLYLDQRENRIRVGRFGRGARALDVYSYA